MSILQLASSEGARVNNFRTPGEVAAELLTSHWDGSVPVRVDLMAERIGVTIVPRRVEHGAWSWCALYRRSRGSDRAPTIEINMLETNTRQRFALAHALGHYALGHVNPPQDFRDSFGAGVTSSIEREANEFALNLLIPAAALMSYRDQGLTFSIEGLAERFGVSVIAVVTRVKAIPGLAEGLLVRDAAGGSGKSGVFAGMVLRCWRAIGGGARKSSQVRLSGARVAALRGRATRRLDA
jgi:Zn-dependent peptidase ImmA (M78 family)